MHLAETGSFSVSPDGRRYAYAAEGPDGILRFWVRTMGTLQPVPLPGTEVYTIVPPPIWSPDSRSLAFDPTGVLKKVSLDGGEPQSLCELPGVAVGGSWNTAGDILLGNAVGGILRCPENGGAASIVTAPERPDERHLFPSFLSDGRRFLYLRISRTNPEVGGIYVGELGSTSPLGGRLITTGFAATFVPATGSGPDLIVFARDGSLFAQRFDEGRLQLIGDASPLTDSVGSYLDGAFFSASQQMVVHRAPDPDFQLTWFNREGRDLKRVDTPRRYTDLALSPRGDKAVVAIHAPQGTMNQDGWLFDFSGDTSPRLMTMGPEIEAGFAWSTNDRFMFGLGGGSSGVYQQSVGGSREPLFAMDRPVQPTSVSRDGRTVLFVTPGESRMGGEIWMRIGDGPSARLLPFLQRERDQSDAQLSPDEHWVAYDLQRDRSQRGVRHEPAVRLEREPGDRSRTYPGVQRRWLRAAVGTRRTVLSDGRWFSDGSESRYHAEDSAWRAETIISGAWCDSQVGRHSGRRALSLRRAGHAATCLQHRPRLAVDSSALASSLLVTTIASAVFLGIAVLLAGGLPWSMLLAPANLRIGTAVPWAIVPMTAYLWAYWKYIGGGWGSRESAATRREYLRANPLSGDVWAASLFAGLLGFAALLVFLVAMARVVELPASAAITAPEGMPRATMFVLLVMASIVAGVTEEASFRGYMQGPIERRYGLAAAILVNGTMFGLLHFPNHPDAVLTMLPYYIAVAAVYGGLTWAANSILPALALHAGGDVWSLGRLWLTGRPEWQLTSSSAPLVRDTGVDASFLLAVGALVVLAGLTTWAYASIHRLSSNPEPVPRTTNAEL